MNSLIKTILSLSLFLFFITNLNAQNKTDVMLFGHVVNATNREHIPYATVKVKGTKFGTITDKSGHYKLANIPVGNVTIQVIAVGYKQQEKVITTELNKSIQLFFEMEEDVLNMESIVVTATKTQHFVKDVPIRTEVITDKKIEEKNAVNLYEALEGTPGIRVEQQCQYCNFSMIRMQGLGAEHTQVLINGQPMYSGLAGVYGLQQMSTVDIGQIEVVKGAGSALYGSSAVAGAINIISKEPDYEPLINVDVQFANHNTHKFSISNSMLNGNGNIGITTYASYLNEGVIDETGEGLILDDVNKSDGISDRVSSNLINAGFSVYFYSPFAENEKMIIRGKVVSEKREGGTINNDYYKNPFTDGTESISTKRYESQLSYNKFFGDNVELNFNSGFTFHSRNATNDTYLSDYLATHNDTAPDVRNMRPYLADEFSYNSTLSLAAQFSSHNVLLGAQIYSSDNNESGMYVVVDDNSQYFADSYKSIADKTAFEIGAFIQDEFQPLDNLVIVGGLRFDLHSSQEEYTSDKQIFNTLFPISKFDESSFNPRVAIKYDINNNLSLRANFGTGFRAPYGFSEDLHLCSGSPRVWKSSNLKPETSMSYNFSADYYANKFTISANVFRTVLNDKIAFTDASEETARLGYNYEWANIDDAYVQGIETSIQYSFLNDLNIAIDFTYNQGEYINVRKDWENTIYEDDSKYISRFPSITSGFNLEYSPKKWMFSLNSSYQGNMYIDYYNNNINTDIGDQSKIVKTNPYWLFNLKASRSIRQFKVYAGASNIFNYLQPEKHLDDAAFMYAPVYGRIVYAGISIDILN